MSQLSCPTCGEPATRMAEEIFNTLVGYWTDDPANHLHDDNCYKREVRCTNNHAWSVSRRQTCKNPTCDWRGKTTCFCHPGEKLDEWPELPTYLMFPELTRRRR